MSLRNFRKQKDAAAKHTIPVPGRSRIQMIQDSDEDSPVKQPQLSVFEREQRLKHLTTKYPQHEGLILQDALVQNDWKLPNACEHLNNLQPTKRNWSDLQNSSLDTPPVAVTVELPYTNGTNTSHHSNSVEVPATKKARYEASGGRDDSDDDEFEGGGKPTENVFDSDAESDDDNQFYMTKDRRLVFEFLNTATASEIMNIRGCSAKKTDILIQLRPFSNWEDLVSKLKSGRKFINTDVLNFCQEHLKRQENLRKIMKKCSSIVTKLENAISKGGNLIAQPSILNPDLKLADYQMIGINWLSIMHDNKVNGILADEMGLGKTIQVIAFLAYLKENKLQTRPHLIVVPSSTMDNWDAELLKWCPSLRVVKYYGSQEDRRAMRIQWAKKGLVDIDILLTTYFMIAASGEEKKMFRVTQFQYVVFDEAHMLKNMLTQRYAALIRIAAERRILLTGTPLQNNLLELMSLLCFVMPSIFASKTDDIKNLFQNKVKSKGESTDNETTAVELSQIDRAKRIMKPFILRRWKKDVLTFLPPKKENLIKVQMSEKQQLQYSNMVATYKSDEGIIQATQDISGMTIMMNMRKLACHPLLLRFYFSDADVMKMAKKVIKDPDHKNKNAQETFEDMAYLSDYQLYQYAQKYLALSDVRLPDKVVCDSGKFKELDHLLPKLKADDHRVLIFSQFTMMLDVLEHYLRIRGHKYFRLDGQTAVTERQDMINEYNSDLSVFVFLLSTRAGGLGINLTSADTVILHDIDFNPYNDKQAEDRCHRMGQTKPVTIYKFVTDSTIEEGMHFVAQEKLQLERDVSADDPEAAKEEHKCLVRLLTMALGTDEKKAETLLKVSPKNAGLAPEDHY